jgi:hypothetical protein
MLKRLLLAGAVAGALAVSPTAAADPPEGDAHNCAGATVSAAAGPGFGQVVSFFAHQQAVDNFNLANCGNTERKNP